MQKVQIFINQEESVDKQIEYISKSAENNKFRIVGRIVKPYKDNTRAKLIGVYVLDINNGTLLNIDKEALVKLLADKPTLSSSFDITVKEDKLGGELEDIKSYPAYLDLHTLYKETDKNKGVLVASRHDDNGQLLYSVMNTCSILTIGSIEYATLTIYSSDELVVAVNSDEIQLLNGEIKDGKIQSSIL